ncbi:MAG: hypothetical protein J0M10_17230 [Chitinophagales bacterium]|nr:hypothetical protein [Chitinophagales bacterium]
MNNPAAQLKRIQDKLQQLLKSHTAARRENERLKNELQLTREKLEQQQKTADELKQQVGVLKMNAGGLSGTDKKELEKKISGYLKEIDRCIALLGE